MDEAMVGRVAGTVAALVGASRTRAPGAHQASWPSIEMRSSWTPHGELKITVALVLTQELMTDTGAAEEDRFEIDICETKFLEAREIVYFATRRTLRGGPLDQETWGRLNADLLAFVQERWRG